jgi:hypothetical protein
MVDYYCMFLLSFYQLIEHQLNILHIYILLQDILNLQCHRISALVNVFHKIFAMLSYLVMVVCVIRLCVQYC